MQIGALARNIKNAGLAPPAAGANPDSVTGPSDSAGAVDTEVQSVEI